MQQKEREQAAAKASLESQNNSLKREVESWKKRVTSLTASFNAVRIIPFDFVSVFIYLFIFVYFLYFSSRILGMFGRFDLFFFFGEFDDEQLCLPSDSMYYYFI